MQTNIEYHPVTDPINIYHRAGWGYVIEYLTERFSSGNRLNGGTIKLVDLIEDYYLNPKHPAINRPWIGFLHHVPKDSSINNNSSGNLSLERLFNDKRFKRDLFYCRGLLVFSNYLAEYLKIQSKRFVYHPKISVLKHPTPLDVQLFSESKFSDNHNKRLIFIGNQDRRLDRFQELVTSLYTKTWLSGYQKEEGLEILKRKLGSKYDSIKCNEIIIKRVSNTEYDDLLSQNLVIVDLENSSANNTILECLARCTPIFVNPVGGVKEYLGEKYPLYFSSLSELTVKLNQMDLILNAHLYLVQATNLRHETSLKVFESNLDKIIDQI